MDMHDDAYRILQQRLDEVEASHARLLNHLPGMAYRCVVERSYEYRMVFASKGFFLLGLQRQNLHARQRLARGDEIALSHKKLIEPAG